MKSAEMKRSTVFEPFEYHLASLSHSLTAVPHHGTAIPFIRSRVG